MSVPSLAHVGERLRAEWIVEDLIAPRDVRPGLEETMPRLPIDRTQAVEVATALGAEFGTVASFDPIDVDEGMRVMREAACARCHAFAGASGWTPPDSRVEPRAPDLRHTRERFRRDRLVDWLLDPKSVDPDTSMPNVGLSERAARAVASALLFAELDTPSSAARPVPTALLSRPVHYSEVRDRVFRRSCWHCHADPDYAQGYGGAGNSGGFGYPERGVMLSSYEGVLSGVRDARGRRVSLLEPDESGEPRLVSVLLARRREEQGHPSPSVVGMPLGLPSVGDDEIVLVRTWIAQGAPR